MLALAGEAHADALDNAKAAVDARMAYRHYVSMYGCGRDRPPCRVSRTPPGRLNAPVERLAVLAWERLRHRTATNTMFTAQCPVGAV
jgi:hypothetical protein